MHIPSNYTARNYSGHTKTALEDEHHALFGGHVLFGYPGNTLLDEYALGRHSRPAMSPSSDEAVYRPLPHHCSCCLGHIPHRTQLEGGHDILFCLKEGIASLWCVLTRMKPSRACCPTTAATSVTCFTARSVLCVWMLNPGTS